MPKVCDLGHHMMQRSCTSQVNFDYSSEQDMIKKFRILLNFEICWNCNICQLSF